MSGGGWAVAGHATQKKKNSLLSKTDWRAWCVRVERRGARVPYKETLSVWWYRCEGGKVSRSVSGLKVAQVVSTVWRARRRAEAAVVSGR
jgi:hypothetical protein